MKRPLLIGIAGGTGAGKTTIARRLAENFPKGTVACVEHDAYYRNRSDLSESDRGRVNYDHPDSLDAGLFLSHLRSLKRGESIDKPIYDFVAHRRAEETTHIGSHDVVIVEGILLFVEPEVRGLLDIRIYVDTDSDIRVFRRIRRDMSDRGRSFDSIREQYYDTVRPMHLEFVEPSKRYADLIIPEGNGGSLDIALDVILERMRSAIF